MTGEYNNAADHAVVANYWDERGDAAYFGATFWLANPAINRHYQTLAAGGRDYPSWVNFTVHHYLQGRSPVARILSVGSGDGALERHLAAINAAELIEGIDIAPKRVAIAEQAALAAGLQERIQYTVCNAETAEFPSHEYDAIYFNSSLHHLTNLDVILSKCSAALKYDGFLFVNEYIGPNRFDFSAREKLVMQSVFCMLPEKYRVSHADHDRGQLRTQVHFPDPLEVARVDPSEAIHSEEIVDALQRHFQLEEFNYTGGTLMQFMLLDIAGNFCDSDPEAMRVLQLIFDIEEVLVSSGDLRPHFAMIIAKHP